MSHEVVLRCYDLSHGLAASLGSALLGQSLEAIWHSGVEVFGREFFFGGGIQDMTTVEFESSYGITPLKLLNLGTTNKTMDQFRSFLHFNDDRFSMETYHLLLWNCNHFANECVKFLLNGKELPRNILHQHEVIHQLPLGERLMNMIQKVSIINPLSANEQRQLVAATTQEPSETPDKEKSDSEFKKSIQELMDKAASQKAEAVLVLQNFATKLRNKFDGVAGSH